MALWAKLQSGVDMRGIEAKLPLLRVLRVLGWVPFVLIQAWGCDGCSPLRRLPFIYLLVGPEGAYCSFYKRRSCQQKYLSQIQKMKVNFDFVFAKFFPLLKERRVK